MNPDQPPLAEPYAAVDCPACGRREPVHRYRLRVSSIVTCGYCAQTYVDPRVDSAELERKLQDWAEQDVVDEARLQASFEPATLAYYARFLRWMSGAVRTPGRRLLDIGCSTGGFLSVARAAGWEVSGIEIGRASARHASETLGLNVQCGSLYDLAAAPGSYDAIAMIEVIEHLEHPRAALAQAHRLLAAEGILLITTPNFDSLYRRCHGPRWWVINCEDEHIVLFTLDTLVAMLETSGFEVCLRRVRGVDWVGLIRAFRGVTDGVPEVAPDAAVAGYYDARSAKARFKRGLQRLGLLSVARAAARALDRTFTWRYAPTYAWGEQLVVVARRVER